jgi:muramidase (phage lysozyme)
MTNAPSGAGDRYYVYRPVLDLIGKSEGTDKGRGYNETLGYGIMLDGKVTKGKGPTVDLVSLTLDQVDVLQTRMLKDPDNKRLNSSAIGRYQVIRTTLRAIRKQLSGSYSGSRLFDADCQDEIACYLLGQRGIDKWLSGRLSLDTLIGNLAQEWASIPKPDGNGHYAGQNAGVSVSQVKAALAEVAKRHAEGQPKQTVEVPVAVNQPYVPPAIEKAVKKQTNGWGWSGIGLGGAGAALTAIAGWPWQTIALFAGLAVAGGIVALVIGPWIVGRVKTIRAAVEG